MSSYRVLGRVSERLRTLLQAEFTDQQNSDDLTNEFASDPMRITFLNPTQAKVNANHRLSLWLFRVEEDEFSRNQPAGRPAADPAAIMLPPLPLTLSYLVTPLHPQPEMELLILGKTLQVFHDHGIVPLEEGADGVHEQLRIILGRISLEELTRVWEALNEPYRLSVCYRVRVTHVESLRRSAAGRVVDSSREYGTPESLLAGRGAP